MADHLAIFLKPILNYIKNMTQRDSNRRRLLCLRDVQTSKSIQNFGKRWVK